MPLKGPVIIQLAYFKAEGAELITAEVLYSKMLSPIASLACEFSPPFRFFHTELIALEVRSFCLWSHRVDINQIASF